MKNLTLRYVLFSLLACVVVGATGCGQSASIWSPLGLLPGPVVQPTPVITSISSPASATAGGLGFQLALSGSGFVSTSVVLWNGSPRVTLFQGSKTVLAKITAADIAQAGVAKISVQNPASGNAQATVSGSIDFAIFALRLSSVSPPSVIEGSADTTLELTGAGFAPGTLVRWNGNERPTTFLSDSKLSVTISASDFVAANIAEINVITPPPTSSLSNLILFPIMSRNALALERISLGSDGAQLTAPSFLPVLSSTGDLVAFVQGDTMAGFKVVHRNTCLNADQSCLPSNHVVSIGPNGSEFNLESRPGSPAISADGRLVAFSPSGYGSLNGLSEVVVRDTCIGAPAGCSPSTLLPSRNMSGVPVAQLSAWPSFSSDGRYVAFTAGDFEGYGFETASVFIADTCRGATGCVPSATKIALDMAPAPIGYTLTSRQTLSADGRYLAYAGTIVSSTYLEDNGIWLHDTCRGAVDPCTASSLRVSVAENGKLLQPYGRDFAVNGTGRYVAFSAVDPDTQFGVFLRDTCIGAPAAAGCTPSTVRVSVNSSGKQLQGSLVDISISTDGRRVAFVQEMFDAFSQSYISNVVLRDMCLGAVHCTPRTLLLSTGGSGSLADGPSYSPMISADGMFVVFESTATNLVPGDTNGVSDVFRVMLGP